MQLSDRCILKRRTEAIRQIKGEGQKRMRFKKLLSATLLGLMFTAPFGWTSAALASKHSKTSSTPATTVSPSPSPAPSASASPSPSPSATPETSPSPEPKATSTPSPSVSPDPSPAPGAGGVAAAKNDSKDGAAAGTKKSTDVGPGGCGGTIPDWVFDTASQTWVAADKGSFTCDKSNGYFLSPEYYFDKRIGWYEIIPASQVSALAPYLITAPNLVHTVLGDLVVGSTDYQMAKALGLLTSNDGILAPSTSTIGSTGSGSNNQASSASGGQSWFDLTNLVNVINTLQSNAASGNVAANSNTAVGSATTGAAMVVANLINLLASAWSWSNGNLNFFMQNILAPQTGDITLNPTETAAGGGGKLGTTNVGINGSGAGSNNTVDANNSSGLNVNAQNTGNITNNVNVNAASGTANATKNTSIGNVASGNATAQVNIINLINSFISSGSSFFGILNIIGNLNGDILFPTGFLNGLVPAGSAPASGSTTANLANTGAGSNNQLGVNNGGATTVNNSTTNAVNNNILTNANSGAANLDSNTSVGNVQTGTATTNQGLFNLSNNSIFGDNAVLVMVNVLGHWVGKIMTLPGTGTSQAALLTGNATVSPTTNFSATNTGAGSNNQANVNNSGSTNANLNSTGTITNNVKVNAQSGNADATKNTQVGSVTTGNAQADSSVANLFNTVLNVKHWFGVLVINVFGNWTGDVNHDSAAGGYSTAAGKAEAAAGAGLNATTSNTVTSLPSVGLLGIIKPLVSSGTATSTLVADSSNAPGSGQVLTAAANSTPQSAVAASQAKNMNFMFMLSAIVMLIAGALATIDRKLKR
jgi:hypothetical protein